MESTSYDLGLSISGEDTFHDLEDGQLLTGFSCDRKRGIFLFFYLSFFFFLDKATFLLD